jgi:hypothetical protein
MIAAEAHTERGANAVIRTAQVLPGTEISAGDGITGALRCTLVLDDDGSRRAAVLKRVPLGEVAAEAFSAVLLRAWGLPVPEPFIVAESGELAFACADAGYPSLRQRLSLAQLAPGPARDAALAIGALLATGLPSAGLAAAADEAIDNRDRNLGNILWDGQAEAWIDHAYALGSAPLGMADANKLCAMAVASGTYEALRTSAIGQALGLEHNAAHDAASELPPELSGVQLSAYVAGRLASLANRLLARFPAPQDLLSGQ